MKSLVHWSILICILLAGCVRDDAVRAASAAAAEGAHRPNPNVVPLAQDYVVVAQVPDARYFFHDPNMALLSDGSILVAAPCWSDDERSTIMKRSDDGGATWRELGRLPYEDATPFMIGDRLYMFVQAETWRDVSFVTSFDRGETWSEPSTIFTGEYWTISNSTVIKDGRFYLALSTKYPDQERKYQRLVMAVADLSQDLLDPAAWRLSNVIDYAPVPDAICRWMFPHEVQVEKFNRPWSGVSWLEHNTVEVNGRIRVLSRCVIDGFSTANLCSVADLDETGGELKLSFTQYYPLPGGQNKFFILYDDVSRFYFLLSNLVTDSQDLFERHAQLKASGFAAPPGNERRWLFLHYSIDCLNWFPAGNIAHWPDRVTQSFMYPSAAIDGDDIVLISRTSKDGPNQHDADLVTFHRIRNFRSLTLPLHPGPEAYLPPAQASR